MAVAAAAMAAAAAGARGRSASPFSGFGNHASAASAEQRAAREQREHEMHMDLELSLSKEMQRERNDAKNGLATTKDKDKGKDKEKEKGKGKGEGKEKDTQQDKAPGAATTARRVSSSSSSPRSLCSGESSQQVAPQSPPSPRSPRSIASGERARRPSGTSSGSHRQFVRFAEPARSGSFSSVTPAVIKRAYGLRTSLRTGTAFITGDDGEEPDFGEFRKFLWFALQDSRVQALVTVVILLNSVLICLEVDLEADVPGRIETPDKPLWMSIGLEACFAFFTSELLVRIFVERLAFIVDSWNLLDALAVLTSWVEYGLVLAGYDPSAITAMRLLRICRTLRLVRAIKASSAFKELRQLVRLMGTGLRTLCWSSVLLALVMTIWAVIAVELVNPLVQDLAKEGTWSDCTRCAKSFSSVMMANITFFKTLIAGDSWGEMAVPIIERHPWTAIILCGSLLSTVYGVLSLIVAVVVDTFAENRANDVEAVAVELADTEVIEKRGLMKLFDQLDSDSSGQLSLEELEDGAADTKELRHLLRVLDLDRKDLHQLFALLDVDGSGELDTHEFVDTLYRMKHTKPPTAMKLTKHMLTRLSKKQEDFEVRVASDLENLRIEILESLTLAQTKLGGMIDMTKQDLSYSVWEQMTQREESIQTQMQKLHMQEMALSEGLESALDRMYDKMMDCAVSSVSKVLQNCTLRSPWLASVPKTPEEEQHGTASTSCSSGGCTSGLILGPGLTGLSLRSTHVLPTDRPSLAMDPQDLGSSNSSGNMMANQSTSASGEIFAARVNRRPSLLTELMNPPPPPPAALPAAPSRPGSPHMTPTASRASDLKGSAATAMAAAMRASQSSALSHGTGGTHSRSPRSTYGGAGNGTPMIAPEKVISRSTGLDDKEYGFGVSSQHVDRRSNPRRERERASKGWAADQASLNGSRDQI